MVFEQGPDEVASYIQPSDSEIFAKSLTGLNVTRFELDEAETASDDAAKAEPRSIAITFEFSPNEWFEDARLEKKFWYRRAEDGWTGLVSEPVNIQWKKGKDPTKGLTKAVRALWDARIKAGDMRQRALPEFDALSKLVETHNVGNTSFFTWFAHISTRRWVSAEESQNAWRVEYDRRQKYKAGEEVEPVDSPQSDQLEQQIEVDEDGEDLASAILNDVWPGAMKFFLTAQEEDDQSDGGLESDDESDSDESDAPPPNISELLNQNQPNDRPAKKQRKA